MPSSIFLTLNGSSVLLLGLERGCTHTTACCKSCRAQNTALGLAWPSGRFSMIVDLQLLSATARIMIVSNCRRKASLLAHPISYIKPKNLKLPIRVAINIP